MKAILGKKVGMTQVFMEDGSSVPVTIIDARNSYIGKKIVNEKGVEFVTITSGTKKNVNKGLTSSLAKGIPSPAKLASVKNTLKDEVAEEGSLQEVSVFEINDKVDVIGVSKGKGFQGVVKRYNFAGGRKTHGGKSGYYRSPGSIGSGTTIGRVIKGKKMPGRMGGKKKTVQNLKIVKVLPEDGLLAISGAIPGPNGAYVLVKESIKSIQKRGNK